MSQELKCANCQTKRMRGALYCTRCGATFAKEAPAPEPEPIPQPTPAEAPQPQPTPEKPIEEEREYRKLFRAS